MRKKFCIISVVDVEMIVVVVETNLIIIAAYEVKTNNGFTTPVELKGSKGDIKD